MIGEKGKGLSAAGASKIVRRVKPPRLIEPPTQYTVTDENGGKYKGTFKFISMLCKGVKTSTLKRRLDSGERNLERLCREPEAKQGSRSRRARR